MFCMKCGAKLIDGAKFCLKCGAPVAVSSQHFVGEPPAPQGGQPVQPTPHKPQGNPPTEQPVSVPPGTQANGTPQTPPIHQPGVVSPGSSSKATNPRAVPGSQPGAAPNPQPAGSPPPPVGYPGVVPPGIPSKKKAARWPWIVCGVGIAAVVLIVAAIIGSSMGQSEESSSTTTSTSSVQNVSLTETYTNEDAGLSFQYASAWKPVDADEVDEYFDSSDSETILVLLANENEDIPEANSYIMVSRSEATEEDEEMLTLDDEAFLDALPIYETNMETSSFSIDDVPVREVSYTVEADNRYQRTYYYVANQGFFRVGMWCSIAQSSEEIRFFDTVMDSYTITVFPEPTEEPSLTPTQYIQMVTGGCRIDDPEFTYGDAFNSFFVSPHWEFFISEDDEKIVEFTGDCTYMDTPVTACIQFVIYEDEGTFEATWLDFNGVPQDAATLDAVISTAFEELEAAVSGTSVDWSSSEHSYIRENDMYAGITFYPDGTFSMVANLYEGLGTVTGTYTVLDDRLSCQVEYRDFGGFIGEDVQEFDMIFAGDNLQYSGAQIGTSVDGSLYIPS